MMNLQKMIKMNEDDEEEITDNTEVITGKIPNIGKPIKGQNIDGGLYEDYLEKKGIGQATIDMYRSVIIEFLSKSPDLENIDDYNKFLLEHTYKKRSYYYYFAMVNFLRYKIKDKALRGMIIRNLIKPKNDDPIRNNVYLTPIKREKVIEDLSEEKHRIIAKIQNQTAARVGDILKLKRGGISYENVDGKAVMKIEFIGKRNKRSIKWVFDPVFQDEIISFIDNNFIDSIYYFVNMSGNQKYVRNNTTEYARIRSTYHHYLYDLKMALAKNNIDPTKWATHDFRRNVSRDIWDDDILGKDVQVLQEYLAHDQVSTTLRYLKHSGFSNKDVSKRLAMKSGKI